MNTKQWCHSVGGDPHNQGHVYDEATGATVAVTYSDEGGQHARLIAAAPDLLAALKQCLAELEAYDLPRDPLDPQRVAVKSARAAIAKAQLND